MDNTELMRMEIKKNIDEIRMGIQQNVIFNLLRWKALLTSKIFAVLSLVHSIR